MGIFRFIGGMTVGIALAPFTGGGSLVAAGLASGALVETIGSDDDKARERRALEQGYKNGFSAGAISAAKKFAAKLERDNNFRFAAFALGFHISKLAGNPFDKVSVIVGALGNPNSKLLEPYVRSENKKIIDSNPSFYQIKEKYLSKLSGEDLKLIDDFLEDVVEEGDYISACHQFYNNDWKNYLNDKYDPTTHEHKKLYSHFEMAQNYYYGLNGCRQDKDLAKKYYIKAAKANNYEAKTKLIDLYNYYC